MSLLQQLSEAKFTKEELQDILDICEHAVKMYHENIESLDKVIDLYNKSEHTGLIKMVIESDEGFEKHEKTIEDVKVYRQELIDSNQATMDNFVTAAEKIKTLLKIFE